MNPHTPHTRDDLSKVRARQRQMEGRFLDAVEEQLEYLEAGGNDRRRARRLTKAVRYIADRRR